MRTVTLALFVALGALAAVPVLAQDAADAGAAGPAAAGPPAGGRAARGQGLSAYPAHVTDPATVERGKALYASNNCAACHAPDIRGTDRGPSLLRSQLVQRDRKGELIAPVVRNGGPAMPASPALTDAEIGDVAEFLHSFPINSRDPARQRPATIVTGNAAAGEGYFQSHCSSCHSATGDLKGLASKYADPRTLQGHFLSPVATQPVLVTVTDARGTKVRGTLSRLDEFFVSLTTADGQKLTIARHGKTPKVEVEDPLETHKALLRVYTDQNIHDLTAYLVTLK